MELAALHQEIAERHIEPIRLTFANLFWIFVACSVLGLFGETLVSFFRDGRWESRAGFVIGPFSPIYGVGGVLITVALNRIASRPAAVLFVVAATVGATFEYFAGWTMESTLGIVAWSYEGQPGNLGGHTSLAIAVVWGAAGVVWAKAFLPRVVALIGLVPERPFRILTAAFAAFVFADAALTLCALDCWYLRAAGSPIEAPWQAFCAQWFGDAFMESRFETMSMWTSLAHR